MNFHSPMIKKLLLVSLFLVGTVHARGLNWHCKVTKVLNDKLGIGVYPGAHVQVFYEDKTGTIFRPTRTEVLIDAWVSGPQGLYKGMKHWDSGLPFEDTSPFQDLVTWNLQGREWILSFQREGSEKAYYLARAPREAKFTLGYYEQNRTVSTPIATGNCDLD